MTVGDLILTIVIFPFKILGWILSLEVSSVLSTLGTFSTIFLILGMMCWISDTDQSGKRLSGDDWPKIKKENE